MSAFLHVLDNKITDYIKQHGKDALQISDDSAKKLKEANRFYANTIGKTFKKRLGAFLKKQAQGETIETIDSIGSHELFDHFLTTDDHKQSAEMFRRMFSGDYADPLDEDHISYVMNFYKKIFHIHYIEYFLNGYQEEHNHINSEKYSFISEI